MTERRPHFRRLELALLRFWHAWIAGAFLVAYLTADEDTYAMHQFAGYAVLAAIVLRLAVGLAASPRSLLRLPQPSVAALVGWFSRRQGRHPLFAWFAVTLLAGIGLAAVLGAVADWITWLEDAHEAVSDASLWVIFAHVAFVIGMHGGGRLLEQLSARRWGLRFTGAGRDAR